MSETGGLDIGLPDEGQGGSQETAREQSSQSFAGSQQAAQQQRHEEKKSKKRDDGVAQVIMQFLTDTQKTHLAVLISRLVARDCPSIFVLAVLSLINDRCAETVEEYLKEREIDLAGSTIDRSMIPTGTALTIEANERMARWLMRMEVTLQTNPDEILNALIVDESNIDGTILQLTSFVLQTFLEEHGKKPEFEQLQQLAAGVLQSLFTPHMHARMERRLNEKPESEEE